ncbi:MAG: GGDEF domain-containing protein [Nanoarchaeota archaeon]
MKIKEGVIEIRNKFKQIADVPERNKFTPNVTGLIEILKVFVRIVMPDINGLKIINDVYGNKQKDEVLKQMADILKACLRKDDILVCWAGEEIPILARIINTVSFMM